MTVSITELGNGLRVVTDCFDTVQSASVGIWVDAGARQEVSELNGVAHFLEHMAFKGTPKRSAAGIAEEIENVGGHLNAYTGREHTAYYARVLKDDVPLAVDILADILQNSLFEDEELARERHVVLQEIGQAHDTPDDIIFDRFMMAAYPNQSVGRPILGTTDTVPTLSRDALNSYLDTHYAGGTMVLSAAGNVDHDAIVAMAEDLLSHRPQHAERYAEAATYHGGEHREGRPLEQLHLVLGLPAFGYLDKDHYALAVLSTLFGGGMSSRLFQEVREKRGLAYSVYSFVQSLSDGGILAIYAGTDPGSADTLLPVLCDLIAGLQVAPQEEEVARARAQLRAQVLMGMESTSARCEHLGASTLIHGKPTAPSEIVAKIDAITPEDVARVAGRLLSGPPTIAANGPLHALEPYEKTAARLR